MLLPAPAPFLQRRSRHSTQCIAQHTKGSTWTRSFMESSSFRSKTPCTSLASNILRDV